MSESRERILRYLGEQQGMSAAAPEVYRPVVNWTREQKIERLTERMQAVRTEVHRLHERDWIDWLNRELPRRNLSRVLVGDNETGASFQHSAAHGLDVRQYLQDIEEWKQSLFDEIDVGITTTRGGIAETGSLILWPDDAEPRLMSLVPPVHVALLNADSIFDNFATAMHGQQWTAQMPTNALLVSGPSKTADIEQTLAYGIHGPKQLIVLILG